MKKKLSRLLLGAGWLFFAIFLISGFFFNRLSIDGKSTSFQPVSWGNHMEIFEGALQCSLTSDDLLERKKQLKEQVFSKVRSKEQIENGFVYYFNDDEVLLDKVLEFVQKEKACCPFFKFDISILPFDKGFALQLSGSKAAFEMIKDFETNEM